MAKFPEHVFVSRRKDNDGSTFLTADADFRREIEDDGPTEVATYKLVEVNMLSKRVVSKPVPRKRR